VFRGYGPLSEPLPIPIKFLAPAKRFHAQLPKRACLQDGGPPAGLGLLILRERAAVPPLKCVLLLFRGQVLQPEPDDPRHVPH
jgi:hypothetical protein